ncbi:hypothetical protein [Janibacter melonis]|nr:hypothetical protein [Janibacter melonis]
MPAHPAGDLDLNTSNGLLVAAPLAVLSIAGLIAAMSSPAADLPEDTVH